ncbi:hypothetical protein MTO96_033990 [Rhipicephalus appendiculatus]
MGPFIIAVTCTGCLVAVLQFDMFVCLSNLSLSSLSDIQPNLGCFGKLRGMRNGLSYLREVIPSHVFNAEDGEGLGDRCCRDLS